MKVARSFFSMFVGWCAAYVILIGWQVLRKPGFGYITDFEFFLLWPALFGFIGWVVFVVPVLLWIDEDNRWLRPERIWLSAAVFGVAVFALLVCSWMSQLIVYWWFPALQGAVAGLAYAALGRWTWFEENPRAARTACVLGPVAALLLFVFGIWPLVIQHAPYFAYRFGGFYSRNEACLRIYQSIRPGDTFADLHQRYPKLFDEPFLSSSGNLGHRHTFQIRLDPTRTYVTNISIHTNQ